MAPTSPRRSEPGRRLTAATTARLMVTLTGGLLVWTWATPPASARQVPPAPARALPRDVQGSPGPATGVVSATRVSGNVANVD